MVSVSTHSIHKLSLNLEEIGSRIERLRVQVKPDREICQAFFVIIYIIASS